VSHDRHLLRTTVDDFWIVADGQVTEFDGDLEDYRAWLLQRSSDQRAEARQADMAASAGTIDRKAQRRQEAEERQRISSLKKPIEKELKQIEVRMDSLRNELQTLDTQIADPDLYSESRRTERQNILASHGNARKSLDELEERWLDLQTALETLDQGEQT